MIGSTSTLSPAEVVKQNAGWVIGMGVVQVFFGIFALAAPLVTGIAIGYLAGILLAAAGVVQVFQAFKAGSWGTGILGFVLGLLAVICGLLLMAHPLFGLGFMTLLLALYFIVDGVCRISFALRLRPLNGWGWSLFGGIVATLLGLLIWVRWPLSGVWAVGVFVGIQMIFGGWTMIAIASAARRG